MTRFSDKYLKMRATCVLLYVKESYGEHFLEAVKCSSITEAKRKQRELREHHRVLSDSFELYIGHRSETEWYKERKKQ